MAAWTQSPFDGLAWLVNRRGGSILDSPQHVATMKIHSTASETINKFSTYVDRIVGAPLLQLDIWPLANLPETGTGGIATFDPISDGTMSLGSPGGAGVPNNTVGQRYQNIDEGAVLNTADYIRLDATSPTDSYITVQPNTSGTPFGGGTHKISQVRLKLDLASNSDQWTISPRLAVAGSPDKVVTFTPMTTVPAPTTGLYVFYASMLDSGVPIDEAFIVALAAQVNLYGIQVLAHPTSGGPKSLYIRRVRLEVDWSMENRVVQSALINPTAEGWATFGPFTNWAKTAQDYGAVIRCLSGGSCVIPTLDSDAAMPSGHGAYDVDVDGAGVITALNALLTETHPIVMQTTAPAASVDCQPYVDLRREQVYTGRTVSQELTPAGTGDHSFVRAVVASGQDTLPSAPLLVKVKTTAGGAQQGGNAQFDAADVADEPLTLHVLDTTLATAATLTGGTSYDEEFSSTTPATLPWEVVMLDTKSPPVGADAAGFYGQGKINGAALVSPAGNQRLTVNQQGLETNTVGWAASAANSAITRNNVPTAFEGTFSLQLTSSSGTGTRSAETPTGVSGFVVLPDATYTVAMQVRSATGGAGGVARTTRLKIRWYTAAGALISTSVSADIVDSITAWTALSFTVIAPATAAFAGLLWEVDGVVASTEAHFGDAFSVLEQVPYTDLPALLGPTPAAPTGLVAVAANGSVPTIGLSWTATALGGSFSAYVIERLHGTKWRPIYRILTEATVAVTDYEPVIGTAEQYRIRVVKTDGTYSLPSSTASATITAQTNQVGSLTSNRQSSLNRTSEFARPLALDFPREQDVKTHHGARYRTVTHAPYDRGLGLKTKRHTKVSGSSRGFAMFNTLRTLLDANAQTIPYICVRDPFGFRAFIGLVSSGGNYEIPAYGTADVELIETTAVPDLVVV